MEQFDVVAIGELLIDFTPAGVSQQGNALYEQNPGGAPANVLVALSRLGGKGCFVGKVGDDQFGRRLAEVLAGNGVAIDGLVTTRRANTTLAFVHLGNDGERSFSFCRRPGADQLLNVTDVDRQLIDRAGIFHFGAVSLTDEPARSACLESARYARERGVLVSFDPNWRAPLWKSDALAKKWISKAAVCADVLKVSEVEMELLTGERDAEKGSLLLYKSGPALVFVTLGKDGCYFRCAGGTGAVPSYAVHAVDTTGAGDAFTAGILFEIAKRRKSLTELSPEDVSRMASFANAVGAMCVQKRGAISAMPTMEEVGKFIGAQCDNRAQS